VTESIKGRLQAPVREWEYEKLAAGVLTELKGIKEMVKDDITDIYLGGVLGAGQHAIVSTEDYPLLSQYSWHLNKSGYAITKIKGRHKAMHRMVLGTVSPYVFVDHIDQDRLNNTRENLRELSPKENANNMKSNVKIAAFGEEKNVGQWVEDPRCEVSYAAFYNRLKKGIDPEEAMQKNGNRRALDA
tara:strand:+ start:1823 stop:2383 length:561 start_codon:yes stop_codon:yes gene_type:complete